jgi:prevent-host-death family protein
MAFLGMWPAVRATESDTMTSAAFAHPDAPESQFVRSEMRQNASRYIARVKAGETIEVTERGVLVALLTPRRPAEGARERLIAEGRLLPADGPRHFPARPIVDGLSAQAVLDEMREDRV